MSESFSRRKERPEITQKEINERILKLRSSVHKLSSEYDDKDTKSLTFSNPLGLKFASQQIKFKIDENISILLDYSEFLKQYYNIEKNVDDILDIVFIEFKAQHNMTINSFLTQIKEQLKYYTYFPYNVLESVVKFYLFKYLLEYLDDYNEADKCEEFLKILEFLLNISRTNLIEDSKNLIPQEEFENFYNEGNSEIKILLESYSYGIYTHTRYIKAILTKLCLYRITKICGLKEKERRINLVSNFLRKITRTSSGKVVPINTKMGGGKINILIISLYSKPDKFKEKSEVFKEIFKNKAKLIIKNWEDKNGIINQIKSGKINGIILTGSNFRIKEMNKEMLPDIIFKSNIPILGLCFGFQYLVYKLSSLNNIKSFKSKNYNKYDKTLKINKPFKVSKTKYRFNHHDYIVKLPKNWQISSKYKNIIYMGYDLNKKYIGIQFHPEVHKQSSKLFYNNWLKFIRKYNA